MTKASKLEVTASCNKLEGERDSASFPDSKKIPDIYAELRKDVFVGNPLHQHYNPNERGDRLVLHNYGCAQATYGWQVFRTPQGTALLEYFGSAPFFRHNWNAVPLEDELQHIRFLKVTFHQQEPAIEKASAIVENHKRAARKRFKANG